MSSRKIRVPRTDKEKPIIGDDASPALSEIIKQGCVKAKAQGHNMAPWKLEHNCGEQRCTRCQRILYFAEIPMPGGPKFGGPAVDEKCA